MPRAGYRFEVRNIGFLELRGSTLGRSGRFEALSLFINDPLAIFLALFL
jgi:hypothetical protein